uniref:Inhibitor of Bruton tyrosine kinase-like n=1 Tax=Sinocyclocheilus anshuiensis TaxID=1608454 RepID=A0A671R2Y9_9TELE
MESNSSTCGWEAKMSLGSPDCTPKCRSVRHAEEVIAALTSGSEDRLQGFLSVHCHNAATLRDEFGRTALHLAASLGKRDLLQWLLDSKHADMLVKDKESGWTALHRSAFYGQIHCLLGLIARGGALSIQDKEGLSALDLTMKDRPAHVVFRNTDPTEVYTWGSNTNFSLGHGNQESRHHPEIVDLFSRSRIYVKQVVLCKFHSVFLSQKGQVYTCGHGQGGRLGHGDEQTYLVPRMVEGLLSHHCSQIAAARDHTVVLTEEGYVYTFGLNTHNQLGLAPPPASSQVPKQVGQPGFIHDTRYHETKHLLHFNGATVCVTEKGDVYLLADYQCKKLASKQLNLKKVLVSGGSLDHRIDPQLLHDGGGEKLVILALDEAGRVFCWRSMGTSVRQCRWAYSRQVFMSDIALSKNSMMFVTQDGEGFSGQWLGQPITHECSVVSDGMEVSGHPDGGGVYERIRLEKLPYVHRAVSITMDSKGRNFGVLQADPKTSLYEVPTASASTFSQHFQRLLTEAGETDGIHDVTLQAGDRTFAAHKYILSTRSDFFRKVLLPEGCKEGVEDGEVKKGEDAVGCDLLVLEKVPPEMLEQALHFIYTDSCEMLVHGARPIVPRSNQSSDPEPQQQLIHSLQALGLEKRSSLDVYRSLPAKTYEDADKPKAKNTKSGKKGKSGNVGEPGQNPVKMLQGVAKKLGLGSLSARLDGVKFENGKISVVQKKTGNKLRFNQKKCSYLCDVTLRSEDGKEFPCHKCVLCARLEYFNSMLGSPWIEATSCTALDMPTTSEVLQAILEYIYTDESPTVRESVNVEFVCNVLVVADQLLITRLKEICEVAITENLTLKNAAELLEFATVFNADQLKLSCLQFIALNMTALLECEIHLESLLKKAKMRAKRKPRRRSDSSGGYNLSDVIQSPPPAGLAHSVKASSVESLQELITSDSEGSYMGAGSPRDLQSPVFQVKPQHLHYINSLTTQWSSSSSTKVSVVPSKMSQKQRKMMALASREGSTESMSAKSPPSLTPIKPQLPYFSSEVALVSIELFVFFPISPWVLRTVGSPPSTSTFASIVEEERQQEAALIRSREKPLALIQIEERAIQDLLLHYKAINNPEELILVERSPQGPIAIPTWNKHRC